MRRVSAVLTALTLLLALPAGASAVAPTNDLPAGAATIAGIPATITQDTRSATVSAAEDIGCGSGGLDQATVWYKITPSAAVDVTVDVGDSGYETGVNIYAGTPSQDSLIDCFGAAGFVEMTAGTTYYLMFADTDGGANGGDLVARLTVARAALDVHVTVDAVAKVQQKPGIATITGTIRCDRDADFAFIDVMLSQRVGKYVITGFGSVDAACGPQPTPWSVDVSGGNGRFAGGKATADVTAIACDLGRCPDVSQSTAVSLRRGGRSSASQVSTSPAATAITLAAAPDNDAITSPRIVGALPYTDGPYSTTGATNSPGDPSFCYDPAAGPDRATVWYRFTPSTSEAFLATTFGSTFDTTLYVGTANGAGGIDVIGCNDDARDLQSAVQWNATAGTTYLIAAATCCGPASDPGGGDLVLNVLRAPAPLPTLDLNVDPSARITRYGRVTITGTLTCANADPASIDLFATQQYGRFTLQGGAFTEGILCDGTVRHWSMDVESFETRSFNGGRLTVEAFSSTCGPVFCASDEVLGQSIRPHR